MATCYDNFKWMCANVTGLIMSYPLNTIKYHAQTNRFKFVSIRHIYNGFFVHIGGKLTTRFITFNIYNCFCNKKSQNNMSDIVTMSLISGIATSAVTTPFDYVKITKQLRLNNNYRCPTAYVNGMQYTFLRDFAGSVVYFPFYNHLKKQYNLPYAINGFLASSLAKFVSYPFDTFKTFNQIGIKITNYNLSHLFHGVTYDVLRSGINGAIVFSVYELMS